MYTYPPLPHLESDAMVEGLRQTTNVRSPPPRAMYDFMIPQKNRSIGLSSRPQNASEGPLSLLQTASPSRLLYSLMIVENLLDRDMDDGLEDAESDLATARQALAEEALAAAAERGSRSELGRGPQGSVERPPEGRDGDAAAWRESAGDSEGEWEVFPSVFGVVDGGFGTGNGDVGGGGVGVGVGGGGAEASGGGGVPKIVRRTWRDRFVSNGGMDTLVELLLARDWDVTRGGGGGGGRGGGEGGGGEADEEVGVGESTVGISLACLALLLVLIERFIEEEYMPEPRQLAKMVRVSYGLRVPRYGYTTSFF